MNPSPNGKPITRFMFRAGMFALSASLLSGVLMKLTIEPFVASDISPFFFLSLVFAVAIALVSPLVVGVFLRLPSWANYFIAIVIGVLGGFFWALVVGRVVVNPFFGNFSFPVGTAWMVGSFSGLISLAGAGSKSEGKHLVLAAIISVLLSVFIGIRSFPLYIQLSEQRTVESIWIKWRPGPEPLSFDSDVRKYLTPGAQAILQRMSWDGHLELVKGYRVGTGPTSRIVVIMHRPIDKPMELPLPADAPIIYIQQDGGWIKHPIDAPVLSETLRLEINPDRPKQVMAWIEILGGRNGFSAIDWTGDNAEP